MEGKNINWFGLAGGIATTLLVVLSLTLASPWWQITVGTGFLKAGLSPLNTGLSLFGETLVIPLLWALNLTSTLFLTASSITLLIYSIVPTKSYSRHLLNFAYKKPLITLLTFTIILLATTYGLGAYFGLSIPVNGSANSKMPISLTQGAEINVPVTTSFTWTYYLAIVAASLCIAARLYDKRVSAVPAST